jgi:integrase
LWGSAASPEGESAGRLMRRFAKRPGFDFYGLRHSAATRLLERDVTPRDVAIQLGHADGGQLVMSLYGHPTDAGARARLLAAWDAQTGPVPLGVERHAQSA